MTLAPADAAKRAAAAAALELVEDGMRLGLGSGSTAGWFVHLLGERVAGGLRVTCATTSSGTAALAVAAGIAVRPLDEIGRLDLAVDGADEFDPELNLIKGGGGALLQEKIVANAAARFVVIADAGKRVAALGAFPLPVEVVRFGWRMTEAAIADALGGADVAARAIAPRMAGGVPYVTDEGHHILDLALGRIGDARALARRLAEIPGVVEHGLFLGMAERAILGRPDGGVDVVWPAEQADAAFVAEDMRSLDA